MSGRDGTKIGRDTETLRLGEFALVAIPVVDEFADHGAAHVVGGFEGGDEGGVAPLLFAGEIFCGGDSGRLHDEVAGGAQDEHAFDIDLARVGEETSTLIRGRAGARPSGLPQIHIRPFRDEIAGEGNSCVK